MICQNAVASYYVCAMAQDFIHSRTVLKFVNPRIPCRTNIPMTDVDRIVEVKNHSAVSSNDRFFQRRPGKGENTTMHHHSVVLRNRDQVQHPPQVAAGCKKKLGRESFVLDSSMQGTDCKWAHSADKTRTHQVRQKLVHPVALTCTIYRIWCQKQKFRQLMTLGETKTGHRKTGSGSVLYYG